ncbi:MAG: hypothetical protein ACRCZF_27730, partial [Gemmataceae bacterium]
RQYRLFSDGKKVRFDRITIKSDNTVEREVQCSNSEMMGKYISFSNRVMKNGEQVGLRVMDGSRMKAFTYLTHVDLKIIGFIPCDIGNLSHEKFSSLFNAPAWNQSKHTSSRIKKDQKEYTETRFEFTYPKQQVGYYKYLQDPSSDNAITEVEYHIPGDEPSEGVLHRVINTEYEYLNQSKMWFPKKLRFVDYALNGVDYVRRETCTVRSVSINDNASLGHYSLKAMNIPPDTSVISDLEDQPQVWDGEKLTTRKSVTPPIPTGPLPAAKTTGSFASRLPYFFGGVSVACIAIFFLIRRRAS